MAKNNEIVYLEPTEIQILDDPGYGLASRDVIHTIAGRLVKHYKGKVSGGWDPKTKKFVAKWNKGDLLNDDALYATEFAISHGLNPVGDISLWYIGGKLIVCIYWRILKGWAEMVAPFRTKFFDMTSEERSRHGLKEGDLGIIGYNILDSDKEFLRTMLLTTIQGGLPPAEAKRQVVPLVAKSAGIGIVLAKEMKNKDGDAIAPPKGRSWWWRGQIRSVRDAIGLSHGDPTPAQVKAYAEGKGIGITAADLPTLAAPIMSELNPPEQKRYLQLNADLRQAEAKRKGMDPDILAELSKRHVDLMRGPADEEDIALGEEPDRESIEDGVIEAESPPTPPVNGTGGNGNDIGQARIKGGFDFQTWIVHLIEACPSYAKDDGQPDMIKILTSAWELGHQTINEKNIADVVTALSDAVEQEAKDAAAYDILDLYHSEAG